MPVELELAVGRLVDLAESLQAEVVAAPLQHGPVERRRQVLVEEREILGGELVLQRLGGGGDDDALRRQHERHQVGERLAGARAGLNDRVPPVSTARATRSAISRCPGRCSAPARAPVTASNASTTARRVGRSLATLAHWTSFERDVELVGVEVGPGSVGEVDRGAGALPQQEVRDPLLAARAHQEVDRWELGEVQVAGDRVLRDRAPGGARGARRPTSARRGRRSRTRR